MRASIQAMTAIFVVLAAADALAAGPAGGATKKPPAASAAPAVTSNPGLSFEPGVIVYTRFADTVYGPAAPGFSLSAVKQTSLLGGALSMGASAGWRHMSGKRTTADLNGRALPQYVIDVDAFPIEGLVRWSRPAGAWRTWLQGGLGAELAKSSFDEEGLGRKNQNNWGLTASGRLGLSRRMGSGELGLSVGARAAKHAFRNHDFDELHGVESEIAWAKKF